MERAPGRRSHVRGGPGRPLAGTRRPGRTRRRFRRSFRRDDRRRGRRHRRDPGGPEAHGRAALRAHQLVGRNVPTAAPAIRIPVVVRRHRGVGRRTRDQARPATLPILLERYRIDPSEAVFIDDNPGNARPPRRSASTASTSAPRSSCGASSSRLDCSEARWRRRRAPPSSKPRLSSRTCRVLATPLPCRKVARDWRGRLPDPGVHDHSAVTTFLFTDIEGSTQLWEREPARMEPALARHDALARAAVDATSRHLVKMTGRRHVRRVRRPHRRRRGHFAFQQALADPAATGGVALRVRCGLHAGIAERRDNDYFGSVLNRAARIMAAAHGGQVLLSQALAVAAGRPPAGRRHAPRPGRRAPARSRESGACVPDRAPALRQEFPGAALARRRRRTTCRTR